MTDANTTYETLFFNHIPALRAYARLLCCGDGETADRLVREGLEKAAKATDVPHGDAAVEVFLFSQVHERYYANREALQTPDFVDYSQDLHERLMIMPDVYREAVVLRDCGRFDYETIAGICGCALGTVKSRVARARKALVPEADSIAP